jgi:hypothetical protein
LRVEVTLNDWLSPPAACAEEAATTVESASRPVN